MFEPDTDDPVALFARWYGEARDSGEPEPDAMALATADADGRPSVRMVLVKGADRRGFVFYTHLDSRKGSELAARPHAALCFHWKALGRQVRVEGPVEPVTEAEADAYFASRGPDQPHRRGGVASVASARQPGRAAADGRRTRPGPPRRRHPAAAILERVSRRAGPHRVLWQQGDHRLHDRFLFERTPDGWTVGRLYP